MVFIYKIIPFLQVLKEDIAILVIKVVLHVMAIINV